MVGGGRRFRKFLGALEITDNRPIVRLCAKPLVFCTE